MRLLFIQGGTRLKQDEEGNWYTDGSFNDKVWERYKSYCDELVVLLRTEEKKYPKNIAENKFNKLSNENLELVPLTDLNRPITRNLNLKLRKQVEKTIEEQIKLCDKAIMRSILNFYTLTALKYCKKYNKEYLIEVAGYAFEGYWHHGDLLGKIVALPFEHLVKKNMKKAPYAVYVTNEALQKRYPCEGNTIGCSDVEIYEIKEEFLNNRIKRYKENDNKKIVLGTIGWLNLKLKGQHDVIKAIHLLKKQGYDNFEYQLVGAGDKTYLENLIKKYGLEKEVKILGAKPHQEVFEWLDTIDVYIQPSYQEGLCRAIVEAMSRACPIIASTAGGNYELINNEFGFKKGNIRQIQKILKKINKNTLIEEAQRSFKEASKYEKNYLDKKRNDFYLKFIKA